MAPSLLMLPGDGIGPEVLGAVSRVLTWMQESAMFPLEIRQGLIGGAAIDRFGSPFPSETQALVDRSGAVLLGAVGGPAWAGSPVRPEQGLLALRKHMNVWANLRPFEIFPGVESLSPLRQAKAKGLIIRELIGGIYFGEPTGREEREGEWVAFDTALYRTHEIERMARFGLRVARDQGSVLVSIDKANVMETSRLWRETVNRIHDDEFPSVPLQHRYVDAAAMEMVLHPEHFPVVITENLFGDVLSDLAGGLVGSLGLLGSLSVSGGRGRPGLFEPVHGSAPDIAGQGIANPIGALLSLAFALEWSLEAPDLGQALQDAVRSALRDGRRTPDLGGSDSTEAFTEAVLQELQAGGGAEAS